MQFLTGSNGPDKWSNQDVWDSILGTKEGVIVSTHQVCPWVVLRTKSSLEWLNNWGGIDSTGRVEPWIRQDGPYWFIGI
jgi:ribosome modulation factor